MVSQRTSTPSRIAPPEQLASETGGRYWKSSDLKNLSPRHFLFRRGNLCPQHERTLGYALVFLLLLGLPVAEWLLRRKWGVI